MLVVCHQHQVISYRRVCLVIPLVVVERNGLCQYQPAPLKLGVQLGHELEELWLCRGGHLFDIDRQAAKPILIDRFQQ